MRCSMRYRPDTEFRNGLLDRCVEAFSDLAADLSEHFPSLLRLPLTGARAHRELCGTERYGTQPAPHSACVLVMASDEAQPRQIRSN
jgi:hypothetical protein